MYALKITIKSIKLLYRASDNGFLASKFHEKCDGIANTLTVIMTEFNRKIGGFTPLTWNSPPQNSEYRADNSNESFIFSLTNNDKFTLRAREYAVQNARTYGPTFGGFDLHVCDKADSQNNSYAKVCLTYGNNNYIYNDVESWKRFTGSSAEQNKFKVKEWEVWGVAWE